MTTKNVKTMNGEFNSDLNEEKTMKRPCQLKNSTLNLQQTLLSFNGRIGEERAWALCHQTAQCLIKLLPNSLQEITNLKQILLHQDGHVILDLPINSEAVYVSEKKAIFSLGFLILQALDYGVDQKEEIILSVAFKDLLDLMTGMLDNYESEERLHETDDEGIGRDSEVELDGEDGFYGEREDCYTLKHIIQLCNKHIQGNEVQADRHYRAVMKAFVHEVLELTQFLEEVGSETFQSNLKNQPNTERLGTSSSQHLDTLGHEDWARFWYQVIAELRHGIKLKKVEENLKKRGKSKLRGAEFELTPYEILMDDIRERRYNLKKTPGPVRNVRKDARTVVLDFIRSRPPLKKASERQLPPRKKESTIRELLMESIKKPPRPLRSCRERQLKGEKPIVGGESRRIVLGEVPPVQAAQEQEQEPAQDVAAQWHQNETQGNPPIPRPRSGKLIEAKLRNRKSHRRRFRGTENPQNISDSTDSVHRTPKKLIPVDFDLKLDVEEDDDDDDDDPDDVYAVTRFEDDPVSTTTTTNSTKSTGNHPNDDDDDDDDDRGSANPWRKTGGLRLTRNEYHRFCDAQLESYDLATQCPSRRASLRKHRDARTTSSFIQFTAPRQKIRTTVEKVHSPKPRERTLLKSNTIQSDSPQEKKPSLGDMLLDERLSLTLEEIVHIRSVLTKAELESLPVEGRVKEDVEKRRVCFLCLKTRFGILGPWGQRCKLCERTICVKCYSKMKIPTEHFSHVPVVLLSPGLLLSPTNEETKSSSQWPRVGGIVGSAPASPAHRIRDGLGTTTPLSTPNSIDNLTPREDHKLPKVGGSPSRMGNSVIGMNCHEQRMINERLRGVSMVVCHDCRIMVIQIIKSSRSTRATIRNNVISRLTLNLSPAYV